jgi:hypothetical protein
VLGAIFERLGADHLADGMRRRGVPEEEIERTLAQLQAEHSANTASEDH